MYLSRYVVLKGGPRCRTQAKQDLFQKQRTKSAAEPDIKKIVNCETQQKQDETVTMELRGKT